MLRSRRVLCAVLALALAVLATVPIARPASADVPATACTANVEFASTGITLLASADVVSGTLVLNCAVLAPNAGLWTIPFEGTVPNYTCLAGGGFLPVTAGGTSPRGAIDGGFVGFGRPIGLVMVLEARLSTPAGEHVVEGVVVWTPVLGPGDCVTTPVVLATATGVAAILDSPF